MPYAKLEHKNGKIIVQFPSNHSRQIYPLMYASLHHIKLLNVLVYHFLSLYSFSGQKPISRALTCSVQKYRFSNSHMLEKLENIKRYHYIYILFFIQFSYLIFLFYKPSQMNKKTKSNHIWLVLSGIEIIYQPLFCPNQMLELTLGQYL